MNPIEPLLRIKKNIVQYNVYSARRVCQKMLRFSVIQLSLNLWSVSAIFSSYTETFSFLTKCHNIFFLHFRFWLCELNSRKFSSSLLFFSPLKKRVFFRV